MIGCYNIDFFCCWVAYWDDAPIQFCVDSKLGPSYVKPMVWSDSYIMLFNCQMFDRRTSSQYASDNIFIQSGFSVAKRVFLMSPFILCIILHDFLHICVCLLLLMVLYVAWCFCCCDNTAIMELTATKYFLIFRFHIFIALTPLFGAYSEWDIVYTLSVYIRNKFFCW